MLDREAIESRDQANHNPKARLSVGWNGIGMRLGLAVALCAVSLGFVACEGNDSSGDTNGGETDLAAIARQLERLYAGTYEQPPAEGPVAARNKAVWVISCGQIIESCALPSRGAIQAAEALGWDANLFDGKLDPNTQSNGIRQAVAANADGLLLLAVDCAGTRSALQQAKADMTLVAVEAADCNEFGAGGPSLFDARVNYVYGDWPEYIREWGRAQAIAMIAETDGKAKVVNFVDDSLVVTRLLEEGFQQGMKECGGCEIAATVKFTGLEVGPKLQQKAQQALLQNPATDAVHGPYDGAMTGGIAQAVKASGRNDEIYVVGGEGYAANMDLVRSNGGQDSGVALAGMWEGYAGMDALNRLFNGGEPAQSGIGLQVYDTGHNTPESGAAAPPFDFESAYTKVWGG